TLLGLPQFAVAQDKKDATAEMLVKLRKSVEMPVDEVRLGEFAEYISDRHGVPVVINTSAFAAVGDENAAEMTMKAPKIKSLPLAASMRHALGTKGATFLVRKTHIEIVPIAYAAKEAKIPGNDDDGALRLSQPLVSAIYKEKPLNEALADLAEEYDM